MTWNNGRWAGLKKNLDTWANTDKWVIVEDDKGCSRFDHWLLFWRIYALY
jgi:hypothetical protein